MAERHYLVAEVASEALPEKIEAGGMKNKIEELSKELETYKRDLQCSNGKC